MIAHIYARHVPAHVRVGRFVADEPKLSWVFPFLHEHPHADALITGGTARDAILGRIPHEVHVLVHGVPEHSLATWKRKRNVPQDLDIKIPHNGISHQHTLPLVHDLARRDTTVNALAYSMRDGVLHDPFDGLKDIEEKRLRTIGNPEEKFHEDPSRTLRILRLASELGFAIEDATWHALTKSVHKLNRLLTDDAGHAAFAIPRMRLGKEFIRSLRHNPAHAFRLFRESGAFHHAAPELLELHRIEHHDGRTAEHKAEEMLHYLSEHRASVPVLLASILIFFEEAALDTLDRLSERLHLPLVDTAYFSLKDTEWLLKHRNILFDMDPEEMPLVEFERIFGGKRGDDLLLLLQALLVTSRRHSEVRERLYAAKRRKESFDGDQPKLLRGRDLLSLGLEPGPHLRSLMAKVRDAQLSGKIHSKTDALDFARHLVCTSDICSNIQTHS